jgi:hypothetical protein
MNLAVFDIDGTLTGSIPDSTRKNRSDSGLFRWGTSLRVSDLVAVLGQ